jgi:hypothetical protein
VSVALAQCQGLCGSCPYVVPDFGYDVTNTSVGRSGSAAHFRIVSDEVIGSSGKGSSIERAELAQSKWMH